MNPFVYKPLFVNLVLLLVLFAMKQANTGLPLRQKIETQKVAILSFFLIVFMGSRPFVNTFGQFGDTFSYAIAFSGARYLNYEDVTDERVFTYLMIFFSKLGFTAHAFFLFVDIIYVGCTAWAIKMLSAGRSVYLLFIAVVSSFSFYSYGINGIRQGMAQALILLALAFYIRGKYVWPLVLSYIAYQTHSSSIILVAVMFMTRYLKNPKFCLIFWGCCVVGSVVVAGATESLMETAGVFGSAHNDDTGYLMNEAQDMDAFSRMGYRWDFLLYSAMPIVVGAYYIVKKKYQDKIYFYLYNTYVLTNGLWVLVNRSWLSNRIAYLSWFIYGIVLIYPMLRTNNVEQRKERLLPWAFFGNFAFTYFMWMIGRLF